MILNFCHIQKLDFAFNYITGPPCINIEGMYINKLNLDWIFGVPSRIANFHFLPGDT